MVELTNQPFTEMHEQMLERISKADSNTPQGVKWWLACCQDLDRPPVRPALQEKTRAEMLMDELDLMSFVEWCQTFTKANGNTTSQYLSHVKSWHKRTTLTALGDEHGMHGLSALTKDMRQKVPALRRRRDGLSKADLSKARAENKFHMHIPEHLEQWAMMQVGIEATLRGAELGTEVHRGQGSLAEVGRCR